MSKHDRSLSDLDPDVVRDFLSAIAPGETAPQHQQKEYQTGWNHERAEQARQRIHITKPWLYSTGAITNLGKKIVSKNARKHGLYSSALKNPSLNSVEISQNTQ
jgi:hypothetical protein